MTDLEQIDYYLGQLDRALRLFDSADREEILRENRSHLIERAQSGRLAEALALLGSADSYASRFEQDDTRREAFSRPPMAPAIFYLSMGVLALLLAVPCIFALVMEVRAPSEFGLWILAEDGFFVLGMQHGSNPKIEDVIGEFMLPLSAGLAAFFGFGAIRSIRSAATVLDRLDQRHSC